MDHDGSDEWHVAPEEADGLPADEVWENRPIGHQASPRGNPAWIMAAVAVVAAALGIAVSLALVRWPSSTASASSSPSSSGAPSSSAGGGGNGGLPPLGAPPGSGSGSGSLRVDLIGKVLAVSSTSITLGGQGQSVSAAFTGSTRFGGAISGATGIKVGDEVSASLTGTPSKLTVTTIQDPAS